MNELKYIPGDLVMTNGIPLGTSKNVVYRVTSSDPTKTLKLDDGTVLKGVVCLENIEGTEIGDKGYLLGDCCAWVKHIVPIPLTPGILEKNGWNKEPSENVTWYKYRTDKSSLYICKDSFNKKDWLVCVALDKHYIANINYVHQLQHLLFGLGLNLEMEV